MANPYQTVSKNRIGILTGIFSQYSEYRSSIRWLLFREQPKYLYQKHASAVRWEQKMVDKKTRLMPGFFIS